MTTKSRTKRTKADFPRDEQGRVILGTAKEMAAWVKLGFEEQDKKRSLDDPFYQHYIDLTNCVLFISYPIGGKGEAAFKIFNLCDMASVVPGIENVENDPNCLFEVKLDIHLDGSILYGNFFHYVKFDGMVRMDNVTIQSTFSCFKCLFLNSVFMQHIHITGRSDFEQCEFKKGLVMTGAKADLFHFNNSTVKERLWLCSVSLANHHNDGYHQSIEVTNSTVENLKLTKVNTDGLPIYMGDSTISGMCADNVSLYGTLCFNSCSLKGVMTAVINEGSQRNKIKSLELHSCEIGAQYHIENTDIDNLEFAFNKIEGTGRLRLYKCSVGEMEVVSSSVYGRMDVVDSGITSVDLEATCIPGYLHFVGNEVKTYNNRETLRLLKNEALKVNDDVESIHLYAQEMQMLLDDKGVSCGDKLSLWINKLFNGFGEKWLQAIVVTFLFSVALMLLMLGFGSGRYGFDPAGEFIGVGAFVTILLDSINVFSIPLFSDTVKTYDLNVWGQLLYFAIKVVVAYGIYHFVIAFRKHGRR